MNKSTHLVGTGSPSSSARSWPSHPSPSRRWPKHHSASVSRTPPSASAKRSAVRVRIQAAPAPGSPCRNSRPCTSTSRTTRTTARSPRIPRRRQGPPQLRPDHPRIPRRRQGPPQLRPSHHPEGSVPQQQRPAEQLRGLNDEHEKAETTVSRANPELDVGALAAQLVAARDGTPGGFDRLIAACRPIVVRHAGAPGVRAMSTTSSRRCASACSSARHNP